jgi:hypothetical protein
MIMAFITKYNSIGILRQIDFSRVKGLKGVVYKKPIYFFGSYEQNILLGVQELFKNPKKFIAEYYIPIKREDKLRFVFEGGKPAFHLISNCDRLNSKYVNFEIPFEIKDRAEKSGGEEAVLKVVEEFRDWFKQNLYLIEKNEIDEFVKKLDIRWNVQVKPQVIEKKNSGIEVKDNLNLNDLEIRIDDIIKEAGSYFRNNPDKQELIKRFAKYSFLAYSNKYIYKNNTDYSDSEIKEFLKKYDQQFKVPAKDLLIEYYRVKFNPELKFEGKLLEQLGFKPCGLCYNENLHDSFDDFVPFHGDIEITDDLPF